MRQNIENLLGRYENGGKYATLVRQADGLIQYTYGITGFGERLNYSVTDEQIPDMIRNLTTLSGYTKVDEVPFTEIDRENDGTLLDWINGVTR